MINTREMVGKQKDVCPPYLAKMIIKQNTPCGVYVNLSVPLDIE
jgi:hypothetical protein